jgi:hypothetical protein
MVYSLDVVKVDLFRCSLDLLISRLLVFVDLFRYSLDVD